MERDCREWKLTTVDPQERSTWRSGVRSAMRAVSQYLERGPLMWMMHLHVNQKSDYDMKTNNNLMKVKSIAECSRGAFCTTFDLH